MVWHGQFLLQSLYPLDKGRCSLDRWHSSSSPCPVVKRVKFVPKLVFMWKWKQPKWKTHFSKLACEESDWTNYILSLLCFPILAYFASAFPQKGAHDIWTPTPFFWPAAMIFFKLGPCTSAKRSNQSDPDKTPNFRTEQVVSFCTVDGTPQDSNTYWVEPGWVDRGAEDASINEVCYSFVNLEDPPWFSFQCAWISTVFLFLSGQCWRPICSPTKESPTTWYGLRSSQSREQRLSTLLRNSSLK